MKTWQIGYANFDYFFTLNTVILKCNLLFENIKNPSKIIENLVIFDRKELILTSFGNILEFKTIKIKKIVFKNVWKQNIVEIDAIYYILFLKNFWYLPLRYLKMLFPVWKH